MSKLISYCLTSFFSLTSFARVPVAQLPAPEGFHWIENLSSPPTSATLTLAGKTPSSTPIFFRFNPKNSLIRQSNSLDNENRLIVPLPGKTVWAAHPEGNLSLEKRFLETLRVLGFTVPVFSFSKQSSDGKISYSTIEDYLSALESQTSSISFLQISDEIQENLSRTRQLITQRLLEDENLLKEFPIGNSVSFLTHRNLKGVRDFLSRNSTPLASFLDVFEPLKAQEDGGHAGFYGFGALPFSTFQKYGQKMLAQIGFLLESQQCPLPWSQRSTWLPLNLRLGILSLLTHNHKSEEYFLKGVIAAWGVRWGWKAATLLNRLQARELACRLRLPLVADPTAQKLFPRKRNDFTDAYHSESIVIAPKGIGKTVLIPHRKFYHLIGAMVAAARLRSRFDPGHHLPDEWVERSPLLQLVPLAGNTYKEITAGNRSAEIRILKRIYRAGAVMGNRLMEE